IQLREALMNQKDIWPSRSMQHEIITGELQKKLSGVKKAELDRLSAEDADRANRYSARPAPKANKASKPEVEVVGNGQVVFSEEPKMEPAAAEPMNSEPAVNPEPSEPVSPAPSTEPEPTNPEPPATEPTNPEPGTNPDPMTPPEPGNDPQPEPSTPPKAEPNAGLSANSPATARPVAFNSVAGVTDWNSVGYSARTAPFSPNFTTILIAMQSFAE